MLEHKFSPEQFSLTPKKRTLLEQFDALDYVEINDQPFRVVDIQPNELKTNTPTLYVPGFSATPEALKDAIVRTAEAGRRVISAYAPHGVETGDTHPDLPEAEMRKMQLFLQLIEAKGLSKVNVIANSEASIYVTAAAALFPEKFENIILIDPAGLIGEDTTPQLLKRVMQNTKRQVELDKGPKPKGVAPLEFPSPGGVGITSILSDPIASAEEIHAIAHSDITKALEKIHEHGIGLSIIHGADDQTFPMERVQRIVKRHMIDGFYSVWGGHDNVYLYEPYGRAAEMALSALENRKEK